MTEKATGNLGEAQPLPYKSVYLTRTDGLAFRLEDGREMFVDVEDDYVDDEFIERGLKFVFYHRNPNLTTTRLGRVVLLLNGQVESTGETADVDILLATLRGVDTTHLHADSNRTQEQNKAYVDYLRGLTDQYEAHKAN